MLFKRMSNPLFRTKKDEVDEVTEQLDYAIEENLKLLDKISEKLREKRNAKYRTNDQ